MGRDACRRVPDTAMVSAPSGSTTYRVAQRRPALVHAQAHLSDEPPGVLNSVLILTAQGLKPLHSHLELIQAVPIGISLAPCLGQPETERSHGPWTGRKGKMSFFEVSTVVNHNRGLAGKGTLAGLWQDGANPTDECTQLLFYLHHSFPRRMSPTVLAPPPRPGQ